MPRLKHQLRAAIASRPGILESTKTLEDLRDLDARAEVTVLYRKATDLLADAEGAQDLLATKGFLAEARQLLELMGRWDGAFLDLRNSQVNVAIIQLATPSDARDACTTGIGDTLEISPVPDE
jgi:hypothetical protein